MSLPAAAGLAILMLAGVSLCSDEPSHDHGSVVMGVKNPTCDDAEWMLNVDWDNSTDYEYRCQPTEAFLDVSKSTPTFSCLDNKDIPPPLHKCMTESIQYDDQPPRGGSHRPLWPVYGEYLFVPPQRWVHSLEHGAVVFLYHPCADQEEISKLAKIVKSCLRRHIITPYRHLPLDQPLALVTYGCKLTMGYVDTSAVKQFIQENALNPNRASEYKVWKNGQYKHGLIEWAVPPPGSDYEDSVICPTTIEAIEENMATNEYNAI